MFRFDNKMITVAGSMILAVVLVIMGMSVPMTGDSGSGIPATEAGDSGGGGVNPNLAGVDPVVAVEEQEKSVATNDIKIVELVYDNSDWLVEERSLDIPKIYKQAELNTLYVCKEDSGLYKGILIVENDEMNGRQFVFCGTNVKINKGEVIFETNGFTDYSIIPLSRLPCVPENYAHSIGDGKYVCISLYKEI